WLAKIVWARLAAAPSATTPPTPAAAMRTGFDLLRLFKSAMAHNLLGTRAHTTGGDVREYKSRNVNANWQAVLDAVQLRIADYRGPPRSLTSGFRVDGNVRLLLRRGVAFPPGRLRRKVRLPGARSLRAPGCGGHVRYSLRAANDLFE